MTYEVGDKVLIAGTVVEAAGAYRVATTTGTGFWWSPDDLTPAEPEVDLTDQDRKELEAALAGVKGGVEPGTGDWVSAVVKYDVARYRVEGRTHGSGDALFLGPRVLRDCNGTPGTYVARLLSHTPAPKPEPYAVGADQLGRPDPDVPVFLDVVTDAKGVVWTLADPVDETPWFSVGADWSALADLPKPLTLTHVSTPVGGAA